MKMSSWRDAGLWFEELRFREPQMRGRGILRTQVFLEHKYSAVSRSDSSPPRARKDHTQSFSVKRCQPQNLEETEDRRYQWKELFISPSDRLLSVSRHDNKPLKGENEVEIIRVQSNHGHGYCTLIAEKKHLCATKCHGD